MKIFIIPLIWLANLLLALGLMYFAKFPNFNIGTRIDNLMALIFFALPILTNVCSAYVIALRWYRASSKAWHFIFISNLLYGGVLFFAFFVSGRLDFVFFLPAAIVLANLALLVIDVAPQEPKSQDD